MTTSRITIEPMQAKYNPQVGRLLVHGFRGKFQHLTNMSDEDLALFFEKLFEHIPAEPASRRIVALQEGEVIGTLSIKWILLPLLSIQIIEVRELENCYWDGRSSLSKQSQA
ncbi:hypothetical protein QJQ58_07405 [Paenibacillus dendritiformis]|uniref:hypothetical protein n=1 Tax=Paenibacillus dendritiformis TaxID=130049 RepID=UPI00248C0E9A|nr:hypothetical protein [Paenibacillus dendritiformis]WGU97839.1 hypothetical protein QJQ58_07405 [Paenibacillus dendritiformis]